MDGEPDLALRLAHDLDADGAGGSDTLPLVTCVGEGELHKRPTRTRRPQQRPGAIAVLDVGRVGLQLERPAIGIDHGVPLAAFERIRFFVRRSPKGPSRECKTYEELGYCRRCKRRDRRLTRLSAILVINPNSSRSVTRSMEACLGTFKNRTHHHITCIELANSPPGIEDDEHVAAVIPNVLEAVASFSADAFVLGCFSDPGIGTVRKATTKTVVGIAEAAYLAALGLGRNFGIVSLGQSPINRHRRYLVDLKLDGRLAGDRSIDTNVTQLMAQDILEKVGRVATLLRDEDKADVIILGCAGLGSYRHMIESALGLPVIDPVQAGVALACTTLDLGYRGAAT